MRKICFTLHAFTSISAAKIKLLVSAVVINQFFGKGSGLHRSDREDTQAQRAVLDKQVYGSTVTEPGASSLEGLLAQFVWAQGREVAFKKRREPAVIIEGQGCPSSEAV